MQLQIEKTSTAAQCETWAAIYNQNEHLPGIDGSEIAHRDANVEEGRFLHRVVLLCNREPVGIGLVKHLATLYHPASSGYGWALCKSTAAEALALTFMTPCSSSSFR